MKILIVHNNYGKFSGEEAVIEKMEAMLKANGHEVCFYRSTTENIRDSFKGKIMAFLQGIYSPSGVKGMRNILKTEKPDVVNVHNLYPFISPASLFECKKAGVSVVMTIHNFRLICPTGLFMRKGKPCELCLNRHNEWNCIRYNCEQSLFKSTAYTLRNVYARWTNAFKKNIDRFVCITNFQREKLIEAGFDVKKIIVIPNCVDVTEDPPISTGSYIAFCGRVSKEKGVDLILEIARRHPEISFKFAGDIRDQELTKGCPDNCELMGYLSGEKLNSFYQNSLFCVMGSKCYEGFPMSILEAARFKKCTVAPNHGGFTEIIGTNESAIGRLFVPNDTNDLERNLLKLWKDKELAQELGNRAYQKLKKEYCLETVYKKWEAAFNLK